MSTTQLISKILSHPFDDPELNWLYVVLSECSGGDRYISVFRYNPLYIFEKSKIPLEKVEKHLEYLSQNGYFDIIQNSGEKYGQFYL